ncbi:MAG: glycosyltransferase family 2 protein [Dysgonamonadaceae bacterium]|jgi:glycosyltransferase involved in cell wall biosynthesis|nr:glycosyltransferase family 2 protein [Dysgonamonadaceae bacterium]
MEINKLISVIVPCYNQVQYLNYTLQSVLNQTYTNWECIVVNDGSTDETEKIALEWTKKDPRFRYIQKTNGGQSTARNAGLQAAQGDFIQFLDGDDLIEPDKFAFQMQLAAEKQADIVVCGYDYLVDGATQTNAFSESAPDCSLNGLTYHWDLDFVILIHSPLISNVFLRKHQIRFQEGLPAKEDWLFWVQCALNGAKFSYHPDHLAHYRRHGSNMTMDNTHEITSNYEAAFVLYGWLDEAQKKAYRQQMPDTLLLKTLKYFGNVQNSTDYKLGNLLLKPYRFFRHDFLKK